MVLLRFQCFKILVKMGIYYEEQSGKHFKVKLKVSEVRIGKISRVLGLAQSCSVC